MSHSETFEAWRPEKASHFESFQGWGPEKASHFESFQGWGLENASHFESSGGCRLRKVSHGESFRGCPLRKVSHGAGLGLYGLRHGVVGASGAFLRGLDLGMVPRGPSVGGWIWGARASLYSMVERRHQAWQGASVSKQGSVSGGRVAFPACSRMAQGSCLCGSDVRVPCVPEAGFLLLRSLPDKSGRWVGARWRVVRHPGGRLAIVASTTAALTPIRHLRSQIRLNLIGIEDVGRS